MAQGTLPAIDEETGRRRSSIVPSARDSRSSVASDQPRPEGLTIRRTSSAPAPISRESPGEIPADMSRMRTMRRRSTSSGLFSGQPGLRSRTNSIEPPHQWMPGDPRRQSALPIEEDVFEENDNFSFKEVKRSPLAVDPLEFEQLLSKRRESQRTVNFLHRQDSRPLLINIERERQSFSQPPFQLPTLEAPLLEIGSLKRGQSDGKSDVDKERGGRYRRIFRFHPFKGRSGLSGLTNGVSKNCWVSHGQATI